MISKNEFATEDMRSVVDKIMRIMDSDSESDSSLTATPKYAERLLSSTTPERRSITSEEVTFDSVYSRMQAFQRRHDQELKKMQEKSEEKYRLVHTHTPTLSTKTRQLISNTSPLHSRYRQEAVQKDQRLKELKSRMNTVKEAELKKELTFAPKTSRSSSTIRSSEEYYKYMNAWKESRQNIEKREREIKEDKVLDGVTFKPVLNKNSQSIMKNMPAFGTRVEKGILNKEAKINEKKNANLCSFRPELSTSKYKKLNLGPVFERLYPEHIRLLSFAKGRDTTPHKKAQ